MDMEPVLTLDDILPVLQDIYPAVEKWCSIGSQLGMHEIELKNIEVNYPRQHDRLREVILKWLSSGCARRAVLIEALSSPSVAETQLADQMMKKYALPFPPRTSTGVTLTAKTSTPVISSVATSLSSTTSNAAGGGSCHSSGAKSLSRLETAVAGLKRKQLHSDSKGGGTPLLRKKLKLDEEPLYDPPSYAIKDFVTPQSLEFQCVRCKRIPRKPLRLKCCNTLYCEPCGVAVTVCPEHGMGADYKNDTILKAKISKLTVRCANSGCEAKCAVYQMKDHLSLCKADKSSITNANEKRSNTAVSAKKPDTIEPIGEGSVTSLASTNQGKGGATTTPLNSDLQRDPLQQGGGKMIKGPTKTATLPSSLTNPQLPPLAEVVPTVSSIPTLPQLQSTLSAMITMMNAAANKAPSSSEKQPTISVPSLKLPGGKEIHLDVSVKSQEQLKLAVPQLSTKVVSKPVISNSGDISSHVTMVSGMKPKKQAVKSTSIVQKTPTAAQKSTTVSSLTTPLISVTTPSIPLTTPTTASSTISTATKAHAQQKQGIKPPGAETLKMGKAFTLSPSQQAEIADYISQVHKSGAAVAKYVAQVHKSGGQTSVHKSLTSAKISETSQKKTLQSSPSHSLTLAELENELKNVATKWRKLGHGLGLQDMSLEQISATNGNDSEKCLCGTLKKCHAESGGKSNFWMWKMVLKTLGRYVLGEKALADQLTEKYGTNVKIITGDNLTTKVPSKSPPITVGTLLANLPSSSSSGSAPSSLEVSPPTTTPTSRPTKATPMPTLTPPIVCTPVKQPVQPSSSINNGTVPSTIVIPSASQMPTVGSALANMGQLDVLNLLQDSPILKSIPALRNLSSPLTANSLLQKLLEVARKATPSETAAIMKSLQQLKPSSTSTPITITHAPVVMSNVTTPTVKSTIAVTTPMGRDKSATEPGVTPLASSATKNTPLVASEIQKASPATLIATNTAMEVEISKEPTTVASTPGKSLASLLSPTRSGRPKSPMSVAVEIPKVKLSGASMAAAMVPKTATTVASNASTTVTATTSSSTVSLQGVGGSTGDGGMKTRQKLKQKAAPTPITDTDMITLSDEDFSMKPRKELHCSKCNRIPMNPRRPKCSCNVVYCETCANAIPNCPLCGKNEGFEEDKPMRKRIWNLKVPCVYKSQGCDWKGELCKRAEHDLVCLKQSIPCKYNVIGCGDLVKASELSEHELECRDQHLQLAMDAVVKLVEQVKALQDEVSQLKKM